MVRLVLCDIEGTLGAIAFVRERLFTYAAERLPDFIRKCGNDPEVRAQLDQAAARAGVDPGNTEALISQLLAWIREDRKETPLKALQGQVWKDGYESGTLKAHVYDDAADSLAAWHDAGLRLAIFSSGSVQAQKLYFHFSDHGDLRSLFSGWFDTTTGPKTEPDAYRAIAGALDLPARDILFLSDIRAELDAAALAGMRTAWVIRPEDSDLDPAVVESPHPVISSLDALDPRAA